MSRAVLSTDTEPLSYTVQVEERGREQLASLRPEAAMSGKWAAILRVSGWGSRVDLEAKKCGQLGRGEGEVS